MRGCGTGWPRALASAGHPSYAVDLRGHGLSDLPSSGFSTAAAAADLAVVISSLGLDRPVVAGQSWGGNVVVRLAATHPALVSRSGAGRRRLDRPAAGSSARGPRARRRCGHRISMGCVPTTCGPGWAPGTRTGLTGRSTRRWPACGSSPDGRLSRRLPVDAAHGDPAQHVRRAAAAVLSGADDAGAADAGWASAWGLRRPRSRRRPSALMSDGDHDLHAQRPDEVAADLLSLVRS